MKTQIQNQHDIVQHLQNELLLRCRKNPNYSMRAYAKQLGVNQSLLSKILRRKKNVSNKMILELSSALNLPKAEVTKILSAASTKDSHFSKAQILRDQFELLSDWFHFAILELTHLKNFKPDHAWMASTLGITVSEVNIAVERLIRYDFIKVTPNGKWQVFQPNNNWSNIQTTNSARKIYQKRILEKAAQAIQDVDYDYRHNTSMTMAVDVRLMPKIKKILNQYRDEFVEFAEKNGEYTDIYQLCIGFYPLTNLENKSRSKK